MRMYGATSSLLTGFLLLLVLLPTLIISQTNEALPTTVSNTGTYCNDSHSMLCPADQPDHCLPNSLQCNFKTDCPSGQDEIGCGYTCDFDTKWDYETTACSAWQMPKASDGQTGFTRTTGPASRGAPDTDGGPPKDHSLGTKKGHYALFLNRDHNPETVAQLLSPWYGSSGPQCHINFTLNMYGVGVGRFKLFLHMANGGKFELWNALDTKGTRWLTFSQHLGRIKSPFRFVFQATRGVGDQGHFALDSISLDKCDPDLEVARLCHLNEFRCGTETCIPRSHMCDIQPDCMDREDEKDAMCDKLPYMARCDFENGPCGWRNHSSIGEFGWNLHQGETPSDETGPPHDHTFKNISGHYMYMEASDRKIGERAVLMSPVFNPPPPVTYNSSSPYYETCQLKFFYHMHGVNTHSLTVHIQEVLPGCSHCARKYENVWTWDQYMNEWLRASIPLPALRHPFVILFVARPGLRFRSDIAIDDISLSPECFGQGLIPKGAGGITITEAHNKTIRSSVIKTTKTGSSGLAIGGGFQFKTCSHAGPHGPTQQQCDAAYKTGKNKVKVLTEPGMKGVQVWTVPENNTYSITVLGASGGAGVRNPDQGKGAYAHSVFNLTEGEKIFMLVGQRGESACSATNMKKARTEEICRHWGPNSTKHEDIGQKIIGGGGSGGGGTFVFKEDPETKELIPLIIAGGGGGKAFSDSSNAVRASGGLSNPGPGTSAKTTPSGPGGGGGWRGDSSFPQSGLSLLQGGTGGLTCPNATVAVIEWETRGGFGGGGGACSAGGGGGGYTGGNASSSDNPEHNGQGGSAYIRPGGLESRIEPGIQEGHGEVEISFLLDCPCEFMCIYKNYEQRDFSCFCEVNSVLADDGLSCIPREKLVEVKVEENKTDKMHVGNKDPPTGAMIAAVAGGIVFIVALISSIFCIVQKYKNKKQLKIVRLERLSYPDHPLDRLRAATAGGQGMAEYNPNYDFGGSKCTLQDLRELNRDNLTLVRALGQGAFGEVYQGYMSNITREGTELAVAIKTLPALCTDQAEMDFLMEALIMSKFNHPNIVRFIGVCFEKHPRFIVLELLEGGDLKTFLRESRPKPDNPSRVTMIDLVRMSLDIAKGCQYLEENHFIHRDIAARNCLLTAKGAGRTAKIADFGMARDIYRADYYRKGGKAMLPVKWMPPEAFLDGIFTSKTDVWSFGILLWEVFSLGYMPYPGRGNQEVMQLVTAGGRLEPPQKCPPPLYHIMTLCWHGISERRPTFATIIHQLQLALQHPEVIHSPLPVFQRQMAIERDNTVMRPRDPEHMVLTVDPPVKRLEPDSPLSTDQLIHPHSPDIIINNPPRQQERRPNLSCSAESLDKLLQAQNEHEDCGTSSSGNTPNMFTYPGSRPKSTQPAWFKDYQGGDKGGQDWASPLTTLGSNRGSGAPDSGQSSMGSVDDTTGQSPSHLRNPLGNSASGKDNNGQPDLASTCNNTDTGSSTNKPVYENLTSLGARRPAKSNPALLAQTPASQHPFYSQTACDSGNPTPTLPPSNSQNREDKPERDDSGVVVDLRGGSSLRQDKNGGAQWL